MKNYFLLGFAISLFTATTSNAQEQVGIYNLETHLDGALNVMATEPKANGAYTFYIDVPPRRDSKQVALILESKDLNNFKENILKAKEVFLNWKKTAIENEVVNLDKEIELNKMSLGAAFVYGKWNFDFSIGLEARFRIVEGKHFLLLKNKNKLQSSSNRFIDSDGFLLLFSTEEEIDEFLQSLDPISVNEHYKNKKSKEDIFTQN